MSLFLPASNLSCGWHSPCSCSSTISGPSSKLNLHSTPFQPYWLDQICPGGIYSGNSRLFTASGCSVPPGGVVSRGLLTLFCFSILTGDSQLTLLSMSPFSVCSIIQFVFEVKFFFLRRIPFELSAFPTWTMTCSDQVVFASPLQASARVLNFNVRCQVNSVFSPGFSS